MKRFFVILLLALCGMAGAFAQSESDFKVEVESGAVTITGYRGSGGSVVIPATIGGKPVVMIGNYTFSLRNITSINIPAGVTGIGNRAFDDCTGLAGISVDPRNTSYTSRDGVLFNKAGDTLIAYPAGKKETQYAIPASVTSIGKEAFEGCTGLIGVNIPVSVTSIGYGAFADCTGLTGVNIPASVTIIGDAAFSGCTGLTGVNIPAGVTSIGESAFYGCTRLTGVNIPVSVTSIWDAAFADCTGLTSINIPASVTIIGDYAFEGCTRLTSVSISANVSLGDDAFPNKFNAYYTTNGKKAGVYTWSGSAWSYSGAIGGKQHES